MAGSDNQLTPEANAVLKRLDVLLGRWTIEIVFPFDPPIVVYGRSSFEWYEGVFLFVRGEMDHPDFPRGMEIFGMDESGENLVQHTFDSRGVYRVYQASLENGIWKIWRDAPGFFQRFVGTFSADGKTIACKWERSDDGVNWFTDFDGTYTKVDST